MNMTFYLGTYLCAEFKSKSFRKLLLNKTHIKRRRKSKKEKKEKTKRRLFDVIKTIEKKYKIQKYKIHINHHIIIHHHHVIICESLKIQQRFKDDKL